jgi:hypothetical protein
MKNPKNTVKYKLLKLMKGKGVIARKDLCLLIFKAQGKTGKEAQTYRPGYYGTNLQQWVREGYLVQPKGGGYKIGKTGLEYLDNPELVHYKVRAKKAERRADRLLEANISYRNELSDANMKLRTIGYVLNNEV